jgi:hypothetical protein
MLVPSKQILTLLIYIFASDLFINLQHTNICIGSNIAIIKGSDKKVTVENCDFHT